LEPIILFDKSFLQSLKYDEARWLDPLFLSNICPIFYIETLADLSKTQKLTRTSLEEVKIIAEKTPQFNAFPCSHHQNLCLSNLLGNQIPMTGQIPVECKVIIIDNKKVGFTENNPTLEAFNRWRNKDYYSVEHTFAKIWRDSLLTNALDTALSEVKKFYIQPTEFRTLDQVNEAVHRIRSEKGYSDLMFLIILDVLGIPDEAQNPIIDRWVKFGNPSLDEFAPYASYLLAVNLFFIFAVLSGLISSKRPSHIIDLAYLYYLPFCMVFISTDKFHKEISNYFLRENQEFIWGEDLKKSLNEIDENYMSTSSIEKEKGLVSFVSTSPRIENNLVYTLREKYLQKHQVRMTEDEKHNKFQEIKELVERIKHEAKKSEN
jgi:hypothetical protein